MGESVCSVASNTEEGPDEDFIVVEMQGRVLRFRDCEPPYVKNKGGGKRRPCTEFSWRARNNMLDTVFRLDLDSQQYVSFITMTYPPECWEGWEAAGRHRRAFLERLHRECERRGLPRSSGLWKKEPHTKRPDVLHFHLLAFQLPYIKHAELRRMWSEVIGATERLARVEVKNVGGSDGAARYVAKYASKRSEGGYLVSGTNLHGGRWWGSWNRKALPWAPQELCKVQRGKWIYRVKRIARNLQYAQSRKKFGNKARKQMTYRRCALGFRVLVSNMAKWSDAICTAIEPDIHKDANWYNHWGMSRYRDWRGDFVGFEGVPRRNWSDGKAIAYRLGLQTA